MSTALASKPKSSNKVMETANFVSLIKVYRIAEQQSSKREINGTVEKLYNDHKDHLINKLKFIKIAFAVLMTRNLPIIS